jgi:hypothetical protein
MRMPIVGLLAAATVLGGCAPALQSHAAECDPKATLHGLCGARAPWMEGPNVAAPTLPVQLVTHKEEMRQHGSTSDLPTARRSCCGLH